jgi:hypothetical protein
MNASTNISSDPKLLTNVTPPVLTGMNAKELECCHDPESLLFCTIENIQVRAETVTPTLKEILDQWPSEHWENSF